MYKINCGVCNAEFTSEFNGKEKCNLVKHIKTHHKDITKEEYLIKYFYNNEIPLCACGCGKETEIYKFRYHKYYMNHKKYVPLTDDIKFKIKLGLEI